LPSPAPLALPFTVTHPAPLDAVQVQLLCEASTRTEPPPPAAANACVGGVTVNVHGAADCVTVNVCPAMVSVPLRSAPEFALVVNVTVPLPLPEPPDETVIHPAFGVTLHEQPLAVVTLTLAVPAPTPTRVDELDSEYTQGAGDGGGGVGVGAGAGSGVGPGAGSGVVPGGSGTVAPASLTTTVWPATRTVPVRSAPLFAAARSVSAALAEPLAAPTIVNHAASLVAFHAQPFNVSIATGIVPPAAETAVFDGATLKRQGAASCVTGTCVLLTSRTARRSIASGFGMTVYRTVALPCPLASVAIGAHAALLLTDHVQSRVVETSSEPLVPPAGTLVVIEFTTDTWHLSAVGAVTLIELDVQPTVNSAKTAARAARRRMACCAQLQNWRRQQKGALAAVRRPYNPRVSSDAVAYVDGLKMLARRELSEMQIRQRLARKGHEREAIDRAVARLREERAIDDVRVAEAIARTETSLRRRGKLRVRMQIQRAGIANATAKRAVDEIFETVDDAAQLEASLAKRLRGRDTIADDREFQRLYRYLIGQGFESDRVLKALSTRRR
jgi:regulatory protein